MTEEVTDLMTYLMGISKGTGYVTISSTMTFTDDGEGNITIGEDDE